MTSILATSIAVQLVTALIALFLVWGMFRVLDKAAGVRFANIAEVIYENPMAVAVYYGLRFLGGCLLVGQLLS